MLQINHYPLNFCFVYPNFRILSQSPGLLTTQTTATSSVSGKAPAIVSTPPISASQLRFEIGNYTDDALKNLDPTVIVKILADSRLAKKKQKLLPLVPANLFSTPVHASVTTLISGLTPNMDRVRSVASADSVTMFMGPFDYLDSPSRFDIVSDSLPTILHLSKRSKNCFATEYTKYLAARLLKFLQSCQLHIFVIQFN